MYISGQHNYNICFWSLFLLLDTVCYIYTSGTTGLPKAVPIKQIRYVLIRIRVMMNTNSNYNYACIIYSINGSECRFSQFEQLLSINKPTFTRFVLNTHVFESYGFLCNHVATTCI